MVPQSHILHDTKFVRSVLYIPIHPKPVYYLTELRISQELAKLHNIAAMHVPLHVITSVIITVNAMHFYVACWVQRRILKQFVPLVLNAYTCFPSLNIFKEISSTFLLNPR